MKKKLLYALTILIFATTYISCSDDDNGDNEPKLVVPEVSVQNLSLKNTILPAQKIKLRANIINKTQADIQWLTNGVEIAQDSIYEFSSTIEGSFNIKVSASNILGETSDSLNIKVIDGFKISDIKNWTGEGENQSIMAIQWIYKDVKNLLHPEDEEIFFLAWGYKWKNAEKRTGYDMIEAIAKKDPKLFVLVTSDGNQGMVIKGFGYDGNGDGKIEIKSPNSNSKNGLHLTETDFKNGIYQQKNANDNIDGFEILSEGDYWIGGWHEAYTSYWLGYGEAVLEAEEYEYSNFYANHRFLENKSWDAWTFSPINSTETNTAPRPELLKAAPNN